MKKRMFRLESLEERVLLDAAGLNPDVAASASYLADTALLTSATDEAAVPVLDAVIPDAGNKSFTLTWSTVTDADSYSVYVNNKLAESGLKTTAYTYKNAAAGTEYSFYVKAVVDGVAGEASNIEYAAADPSLAPTLAKPVTNSTNGTITLSWSKVSIAEDYCIYCNDAFYAETEGTSYVFNGAQAGTEYNFFVVAYDEDFTAGRSNTQTAPVILEAPVVDDPEISGTTVTLTFDEIDGANFYKVYYSTDSGFRSDVLTKTVAETQAAITGLDEGDTYYFRVRAYDTSNKGITSDYSNTVSASIVATLDVPTGLKVTAEGSSAKLTWNSVKNADGYVLAYSTDSSAKISEWETVSTTNTAYTLSDLAAGKYYFKVKAASTGEIHDSAYSAAVSTTILVALDAPELYSATADNTTVTVLFNTVDGADKYEVYASTDPDFEKNVKTLTVSSGKAVFTNLSEGNLYYFSARAYNSQNKSGTISEYADPITAVVLKTLAVPTGLKVTSVSDNTAVLKWNSVANADGYVLAYSTDSKAAIKDWDTISTTGTTYNFNGIEGVTYYFKVKAASTSELYNDSDYSAAVSTTLADHLDAPELYSAVPEGTAITVTFGAVDGADTYKVYCSADQNFEKNVKQQTVTKTSAVFTSLTAGTTYYFRAQAYNSADKEGTISDYSEVISATVLKTLSTPTNFRVTSTSGDKFVLKWNSVKNADGYTIAYTTDAKADIEDWDTVSTTDTTYTFTDLTARKYYFKIKASSTSEQYADSPYSSTISAAHTQLDAPELESITVSGTKAVVEYSKVEGANRYKVYCSKTEDFSKDVRTLIVTKDHATFYGLAKGNVYYFAVQAYHTSNMSGTMSELSEVGSEIVYNTLAKPGIYVKSTDANSATLKWNAVKNADEYILAYSTDSKAAVEDWNTVSTTETQYTLDNLPAGKYYFRVCATSYSELYKDSGFSAAVSTKIVDKLDAPYIYSATIDGTKGIVEFSTVEGANRYKVYCSKSYDLKSGVRTMVVTKDSATFYGLSKDTTYYFCVQAYNTSNMKTMSDYSEIVEADTVSKAELFADDEDFWQEETVEDLI